MLAAEPYSARNATSGSTRLAPKAGTAPASTATMKRERHTTPITTGSFTVALKSNASSSRLPRQDRWAATLQPSGQRSYVIGERELTVGAREDTA
jgi:hypothetical protein